jgi:hypothetical protein
VRSKPEKTKILYLKFQISIERNKTGKEDNILDIGSRRCRVQKKKKVLEICAV